LEILEGEAHNHKTVPLMRVRGIMMGRQSRQQGPGLSGYLVGALAVLTTFGALIQAATPPASAEELQYRTPADDPAVLSAAERFVWQALNDDRRVQGMIALKADPTLCSVARRHSDDMMQGRYLGDVSPRLGDIHYQLHRRGWSTTIVRYQVFRTFGLEQMLEQLRGQERPLHLMDFTHAGIGVAELKATGECYVSVIASKCFASLDPFPIMVEPDTSRRLSGGLTVGLQDPRVVISSPDGLIYEVQLRTYKPNRFEADVVYSRGAGEYLVEVVACGKRGQVTTNIMRVFAATPYPAPDVTDEKEARPSPDQAERLMLTLINEERTKRNVEVLLPDAALANVARAHSLDMKTHDFFAHVAPREITLPMRLSVAGIQVKALGENIVMETSVKRAHRSLMESPEHRRNVLSKDYDRVGIGIVRDDKGFLFATQDFGRKVASETPPSRAETLMTEFNTIRTRAGLPMLKLGADLEAIASMNSKAMREAGESSSEVADEFLGKRGLLTRVSVFTGCSAVEPAADEYSEALIRDPMYPMKVGIAITEGKDKQTGERQFWTTVIFAREK
jgi:uncharacterized protein YkwD